MVSKKSEALGVQNDWNNFNKLFFLVFELTGQCML